MTQADCCATTSSSSPPIPRKRAVRRRALNPCPAIDFAPMEDAVDRLKRSAKAYDEALAKNAAALSADQLAHCRH